MGSRVSVGQSISGKARRRQTVMGSVVRSIHRGKSRTLGSCARGFSNVSLSSFGMSRTRVRRTFDRISKGVLRVVGTTTRGVQSFRRGRLHPS